MNETLNLHRQRTKWTADIELDNISHQSGVNCFLRSFRDSLFLLVSKTLINYQKKHFYFSKWSQVIVITSIISSTLRLDGINNWKNFFEILEWSLSSKHFAWWACFMFYFFMWGVWDDHSSYSYLCSIYSRDPSWK